MFSFFCSHFWTSTNIRNGRVATTCSNGTNNSALVFGENINHLPYRNFLASHSALTNIINLSNKTNNISITPPNFPPVSGVVCTPPYTTLTNSEDSTSTDKVHTTISSIDDSINNIEADILVSLLRKDLL